MEEISLYSKSPKTITSVSGHNQLNVKLLKGTTSFKHPLSKGMEEILQNSKICQMCNNKFEIKQFYYKNMRGFKTEN